MAVGPTVTNIIVATTFAGNFVVSCLRCRKRTAFPHPLAPRKDEKSSKSLGVFFTIKTTKFSEIVQASYFFAAACVILMTAAALTYVPNPRWTWRVMLMKCKCEEWAKWNKKLLKLRMNSQYDPQSLKSVPSLLIQLTRSTSCVGSSTEPGSSIRARYLVHTWRFFFIFLSEIQIRLCECAFTNDL